MRLLICGDRHWNDLKLIREEIEAFQLNVDVIECIIEGGASGADTCAKLLAIEMNIAFEEFPADWELHGKRAGPIRNQQMLDEGKPDFVLGFHDDFENSKGTKSMIKLAEKAGVPAVVIGHEGQWDPVGTVHPVTPRPARPNFLGPIAPVTPNPIPYIPPPMSPIVQPYTVPPTGPYTKPWGPSKDRRIFYSTTSQHTHTREDIDASMS